MTSLVHSLRQQSRNIEVWLTPCIVTMPPTVKSTEENETLILLNPANERLCGTQFSHFPVGGPTPSAPRIGIPPPFRSRYTMSSTKTRIETKGLGSVKNAEWGLYQCEAIDGIVTELCGMELERYIKEHVPVWYHPDADASKQSTDKDYVMRCNVGEAIHTPAFGLLKKVFVGGIVHVVPPFYSLISGCNEQQDKDQKLWIEKTQTAYTNGIHLAFSNNNDNVRSASRQDYTTKESVAALICPIIGSGARGAPFEKSGRIAISSALQWQRQKQDQQLKKDNALQTIRFGVLDDDHADYLSEALDELSSI